MVLGKCRLSAVCAILAVALVPALGQQAQPQEVVLPVPDSHDYRLGPGDLLEVSVFGVSDFSQAVRVSSSGTIALPFLGRIQVEGMTGQELEQRLTEMITEQKLIRDPQVSVFIKEYRSQPIYVLGAVNQPGQYMATHPLRLLDALTMAGGLDTRRSADYLILQRKAPARSTTGEGQQPSANAHENDTTRIDLDKLLEKGDMSLNVTIQGGDVIQVPERKIEVYYVVGEVTRAGVFEFPKDRAAGVLATQALAAAGGPMKTAKMGDGVLVRYVAGGQPRREKIDFGAVLKGKKPDISLQPNDIVFLPGSNMKTLGYGMLAIIPGTVSGAIVWRGLVQ
jgi:polysaccharide biosynthesis/export protein